MMAVATITATDTATVTLKATEKDKINADNNGCNVHDRAQQGFSGPASQGCCSPKLPAVVPPHPPGLSWWTRHFGERILELTSPPLCRGRNGNGNGGRGTTLTWELSLDNSCPARGVHTLLVDGSGWQMLAVINKRQGNGGRNASVGRQHQMLACGGGGH
jgi:hypothetical protein